MDHACECCRMSAALGRDGLPVFAWRQIFEGEIRDHYAAKLSFKGDKLTGGRVSNDNWAINSCPHQGPALAVDAKGLWHITWFTKGKNRQGLFYAFSRDEGKNFSTPEKRSATIRVRQPLPLCLHPRQDSIVLGKNLMARKQRFPCSNLMMVEKTGVPRVFWPLQQKLQITLFSLPSRKLYFFPGEHIKRATA